MIDTVGFNRAYTVRPSGNNSTNDNVPPFAALTVWPRPIS